MNMQQILVLLVILAGGTAIPWLIWLAYRKDRRREMEEVLQAFATEFADAQPLAVEFAGGCWPTPIGNPDRLRIPTTTRIYPGDFEKFLEAPDEQKPSSGPPCQNCDASATTLIAAGSTFRCNTCGHEFHCAPPPL